MHTLNGNLPAKMQKDKKVKAFATSAFEVSQTEFSRALSKLCGHEINWISEKNGDCFNGEVIGMGKFYAFWWRATKRANFSGKGAGAAKRWVLQELEKGHQPKELNEQGAKEIGLPSKPEESQRRLFGKKGCPNVRKTETSL